VVNHTHPDVATALTDFLALTEADALLMRGTEGEPVADARRLPTLRAFVRGREQQALSVAGPGGSLGTLPGAPVAIEAAATAEAIRDMLAGRRPVPAPIERQRDCLLALRRAMGASA
jgi:anthranilate phosphoribosyltransferase